MVLEDRLAVAVAKVSTGGSQGGAEPGPHAGAAKRTQTWRRVRKGWEPPTLPQPTRDAALSLWNQNLRPQPKITWCILGRGRTPQNCVAETMKLSI